MARQQERNQGGLSQSYSALPMQPHNYTVLCTQSSGVGPRDALTVAQFGLPGRSGCSRKPNTKGPNNAADVGLVSTHKDMNWSGAAMDTNCFGRHNGTVLLACWAMRCRTMIHCPALALAFASWVETTDGHACFAGVLKRSYYYIHRRQWRLSACS